MNEPNLVSRPCSKCSATITFDPSKQRFRKVCDECKRKTGIAASTRVNKRLVLAKDEQGAFEKDSLISMVAVRSQSDVALLMGCSRQNIQRAERAALLEVRRKMIPFLNRSVTQLRQAVPILAPRPVVDVKTYLPLWYQACVEAAEELIAEDAAAEAQPNIIDLTVETVVLTPLTVAEAYTHFRETGEILERVQQPIDLTVEEGVLNAQAA